MATNDDVFIPKLKIDQEGGFSIQALNDIIRRIFTRLYALEGRTEESVIRNNASILGSLTLDGVSDPGVSEDGDAKIYFDETLRKLQVSEDGDNFVDLVPAEVEIQGTTNQISVSGGGGSPFVVGFPENVALGTVEIIPGDPAGLPYIPSRSGILTSTPASIPGFVPILDATDHRTLFHYTGGVWLGAYDRTVLTPAQITADENNYDPGTYSYIWRLETDAPRTLTGIAGHNSVAGLRLIIINIGAPNLILAHQNASSTASNRMICPGAANLTIAANQAALLIYDVETGRWRVFSL